MDTDQEAVWAAVQSIDAAFLARHRVAIDANISPEATVWDSAHEALVRGREQLDAVWDARPPGGPTPTGLEARKRRGEPRVTELSGSSACRLHNRGSG